MRKETWMTLLREHPWPSPQARPLPTYQQQVKRKEKSTRGGGQLNSRGRACLSLWCQGAKSSLTGRRHSHQHCPRLRTELTGRLGRRLSGSYLFQGWNEGLKQKHPPSLGVRRFYAIVGSHLYYTKIYFYWKFKSNWKPWVFICLICPPSSCWMSVSSQLLCRTTWSACPHYWGPWLLFSSEQASLLTMNQPYLNRYPFCCTIFYSIFSYFWYYMSLIIYLHYFSLLFLHSKTFNVIFALFQVQIHGFFL